MIFALRLLRSYDNSTTNTQNGWPKFIVGKLMPCVKNATPQGSGMTAQATAARARVANAPIRKSSRSNGFA